MTSDHYRLLAQLSDCFWLHFWYFFTAVTAQVCAFMSLMMHDEQRWMRERPQRGVFVLNCEEKWVSCLGVPRRGGAVPLLCKYPPIALQDEMVRQGWAPREAAQGIAEVYKEMGRPISEVSSEQGAGDAEE